MNDIKYDSKRKVFDFSYHNKEYKYYVKDRELWVESQSIINMYVPVVDDSEFLDIEFILVKQLRKEKKEYCMRYKVGDMVKVNA